MPGHTTLVRNDRVHGIWTNQLTPMSHTPISRSNWPKSKNALYKGGWIGVSGYSRIRAFSRKKLPVFREESPFPENGNPGSTFSIGKSVWGRWELQLFVENVSGKLELDTLIPFPI